MVELLLAPGMPFYALSLAGTLLAAAGLMRMEQARLALAGFRLLPNRRGMTRRFLLGQLAALPIVATILLTMFATGAAGAARTLLLSTAAAVYLHLGWAVPRRPIVQAQKERRILRRLTPGFVSYVRVALTGGDSPARVLERYVARPEARRSAMQEVVRESLQLVLNRRQRPFEALRTIARARDVQELMDVADALAQGETLGGSSYEQALEAHERTLLIILDDEFKRMLKKRTLYLLLAVAISLVIGILGNLLWIMAGPVLLDGTL